MANGESDEGVLGLLEDIEAEPEAPFRAWGRPPAPRPTPPRPMPPAQQGQFVPFSTFQRAIDQLSAQMRSNTEAINTVNARVVTTATRLERAIKEQKKEYEQSLKKVRDMSLLPMLLSTPPQLSTVTLQKDVTDGKGTTIIPAQTKLVTGYGAAGNQMMPLLLLMMAGGLGDSKSGGGDDQSLLLLALVMMGNPQTGR